MQLCRSLRCTVLMTALATSSAAAEQMDFGVPVDWTIGDVQGPQRGVVLIGRVDPDNGNDAIYRERVERHLADTDRFIREASFEQAWLDLTFFGPLPFDTTDCLDSWQDPTYTHNPRHVVLPQLVAAVDPVVDFSAVDHVYVTLVDEQHRCPVATQGWGPGWGWWGGVPTDEGTLGGSVVLGGSVTANQIWYPWAHEVGHTFGGSHVEYFGCTDKAGYRRAFDGWEHGCGQLPFRPGLDTMANAYAHYTAVHKSRFGWLLPEEHAQVEHGHTFLVPSNVDVPGVKLLRVPRSGANGLYTSYLLEYRRPVGYDAATPHDGPIDGVYLYVQVMAGHHSHQAVELGPLEGGAPVKRPLPLAWQGQEYVPSFIDHKDGFALYVECAGPSGAWVTVADYPPPPPPLFPLAPPFGPPEPPKMICD